MGATSITGVGIGDSNGLQKPENHCGCGCGSTEEEPVTPLPKRGCVTSLKTGNKSSINIGKGTSSLKVC